MNKIILFSGGTAVGKTSVIKWILRMLMNKEVKASICKIDCLFTEDQKIYEKLGYECLVGLSGDICPDHYLVSNLPELW